jgi:5-formyltetrahydrofolate cyclo-ligase
MSGPKSDADTLAALGQQAKKQLRARLGATRNALPAAAVAARSARIVEALGRLDVLQRARSVASFWPMAGRGEVDLRAFDAELERRGVVRFYPFMDPNERGFTTGFRPIRSALDLQPRGRKFVEPSRDAPAAKRGDIDVVIVPALAVTPAGHRLGHGVGFYDSTLPDVAPPAFSVVVAFSFQLLGELFVEPHDVACDLVVTDAHILDPRQQLG